MTDNLEASGRCVGLFLVVSDERRMEGQGCRGQARREVENVALRTPPSKYKYSARG